MLSSKKKLHKLLCGGNVKILLLENNKNYLTLRNNSKVILGAILLNVLGKQF